MKNIYYAIIRNGQMCEINCAEYGNEWESVEAYIENALDDMDGVTLIDGIHGDFYQNFGGHNNNPEQFITLCIDGQPHEVWWMDEDEE